MRPATALLTLHLQLRLLRTFLALIAFITYFLAFTFLRALRWMETVLYFSLSASAYPSANPIVQLAPYVAILPNREHVMHSNILTVTPNSA